METRKSNKLAMFLSVLTACDRYKALWETRPAFTNAHAKFATHVQTIRKLVQSKPSKGASEHKRKLRLAMCEAAGEVAAGIRAYANTVDDYLLHAKVDYSLSELLTGRDTQSSDRCEIIHATGTELLPKLADFDVTSADLDALRKKIDAYDADITKPRDDRAITKAIRTQLDREFEKADAVLQGQLDELMNKYQAPHPGFFKEYKAARVIIDRPGADGGTPSPAPQPPEPPPSQT